MALNLYQTESDDIFLWLLTIDAIGHPKTHIVNNTEDVTSRGQIYVAWPFKLVLSVDDGERLPQLKLTINNVDESIMRVLRDITEPPSVKIELVLAKATDDVEMTIDFLKIRDITYNAETITAQLQSTNLLSRRYPHTRYTPSNYPGMFYQ